MASPNLGLQLTGTEMKPPAPPQGVKVWTRVIEDAYRLQLAGFRSESIYLDQSKEAKIDRWPDNEGGFIKKIKRQDGSFYYFNRERECMDKDVHSVVI